VKRPERPIPPPMRKVSRGLDIPAWLFFIGGLAFGLTFGFAFVGGVYIIAMGSK
jgi:hypothetical protein